MKLYSALAIVLILGVMGCSNDDEEKLGPFEGVALFDENGNPLGCWESCGEDWLSIPLNAKELDFVTFEDTISFVGNENATVEEALFFPNPIALGGHVTFGLRTNTQVKVKVAIVGHDEKVANRLTFMVDEANSFVQFNNALFEELELLKIHRIYYQATTPSGKIVFEGYGDFGLCTEPSNPDLSTCFE